MKLTREEQSELSECLLDMGQLLLESGAEISRVEDTLSRIGRAYGARRVDAFAITAIISLSIEFSDSESATDTRRISSSAGTDFSRIEKLNELSRRACRECIPLSELRDSLTQIAAVPKEGSSVLAGSILAAGGFAVFFGGTLIDGIAASVFAGLIFMLQGYLGGTEINPSASNLLISFIIGLGVGTLCRAIPILNMDKILIGDIMLLIPGLALTNSVRNMLSGNTISGVVRLTECFIWALSLAGGFMTAMMLLEAVL